MTVFINYRREDSASDARLLYERLTDRFGRDAVFLDVVSLRSGMEWLEEIKSRGASSSVFLALIGRGWMSSMKMRAHAAVAAPAEDYVKLEIQTALTRRPEVGIIPVLIGDAPPPIADQLPRSIRALADFQIERVRHDTLDEDITRLADRIKELADQPIRRPPRPRETREDSAASGEIGEQYEEVLRYMVDEGTVVPLLGTRANLPGTDPQHPGAPDAQQLAGDLARRFRVDARRGDLAAVAQYVAMTEGRPDLYRTLKQLLPAEAEPGPVHRFLARFPRLLEELGRPPRHQMIVTSSYDTALERAFDSAHVPYDLAVYMASGDDKGKFVHFPFDGPAEPVTVPNKYGKFPIDDYGELERTLIVKIQGAVDGVAGDYRWKENFVITEDHFIDYLSTRPIESLIPVQILDKLTSSHCLFLGYLVGDWNLRVFLKRVWQGVPIDAASWAVEQNPSVLERRSWARFGVDVVTEPLDRYLDTLSAALERRQVPT